MREKTILALSVFLVIGMGLALSGCETTSSGGSGSRIIGSYDLKFGIVLPSMAGPPEVVRDVRSVEKIIDRGHAHGFTVRRKGGGRFMVSYSVRFPEPLAEAEQGLAPSGAFSEGGRVYTSQEDMVWDIGFNVFYFSESDPLGPYELSIFIDGALYEMIRYEVIEPLL